MLSSRMTRSQSHALSLTCDLSVPSFAFLFGAHPHQLSHVLPGPRKPSEQRLVIKPPILVLKDPPAGCYTSGLLDVGSDRTRMGQEQSNICLFCDAVLWAPMVEKWTQIGPEDHGIEYATDIPPATLECADCMICREAGCPAPETWTSVHATLRRRRARSMYYSISFEWSSDTSRSTGTVVLDEVDEDIRVRSVLANQSGWSGSEVTMRLISTRLTTCLQTHQQCPKNTQPQWYPARLLKLEDEMIRLVDTSLDPPQGPYATLSHCWGKERFELLTMENKAKFEAGQSIIDFLPTFRDALFTASRIGLRYVWIDCFCIIQSSVHQDAAFIADKAAQLRTMDKVYANAVLNIAAAHGSSPQDGCFVRRFHPVHQPKHFRWCPDRESLEQPWKLYGVRSRGNYAPLYNYKSKQPLWKRGWVMQERLMASRICQFTAQGVFWECAGLRCASDGSPYGRPEHAANIRPAFTLEEWTATSNLTSARGMWKEIVRDFTGLGLSYPAQDKLSAVSAIARAVARQTGNDYMAGLFPYNAVEQLCWTSVHTGMPPMKPIRGAQAPSWSWAAVESPVCFDPIEVLAQVASVVDVELEYIDLLNPFGPVNAGRLTLEGHMAPLELSDYQVHGITGLIFDFVIDGISHKQPFSDMAWDSDVFGLVRDRKFAIVPLIHGLQPSDIRSEAWRRRAAYHGVVQTIAELSLNGPQPHERVQPHSPCTTGLLLMVEDDRDCYQRIAACSMSSEIYGTCLSRPRTRIVMI